MVVLLLLLLRIMLLLLLILRLLLRHAMEPVNSSPSTVSAGVLSVPNGILAGGVCLAKTGLDPAVWVAPPVSHFIEIKQRVSRTR